MVLGAQRLWGIIACCSSQGSNGYQSPTVLFQAIIDIESMSVIQIIEIIPGYNRIKTACAGQFPTAVTKPRRQ